MRIWCHSIIVLSILILSAQVVAKQASNLDSVDQLINLKRYEKAIEYIDSLFESPEYNTNSKLKSQLLVKKADCFYYLNNLETSFEYYLLAATNEELQLENDKSLISEAYGNAAYCLTTLGLNEQSIKYSLLAYNYVQDSAQLAVISTNLAVSYRHTGNYKLAFDYFEQAYTIDKNLKDSIGIAYDLNSLGYLFKEWEKYDQALAYFSESMAIVKKANLKKEMATRFNNIAQVYLAMDNLLEAERNISKAVAIDKEIKDRFGLAKHLNLLGQIASAKKDYKQAIEYQLQALAIHQELKTRNTIAITYRLLAENYLKLEQNNTAINWLDKGIILARDIGFTSELLNQYKLKTTYLYSINNLNEAKLYENSYRTLEDSMYSIENNNKIYQLELATEMAKKEIEIEQQKNLAAEALQSLATENRAFTTWLIIGFVLLAFVFGYLFRVNYIKKSHRYQEEIAELQGKLQALTQNDPESFSIKIKDINGQLDNPLSEKEFEVVKFIFTKKSNVEIGTELELSVNTVKYHFKNIYKKFGVSNRKEALQFLLAPA